jgi:predicted AlkP superfamily phosphohydrolase/phosphomutase
MRAGVVGWMVTSPAEPVNGYLVSDYIQYGWERDIEIDRQTWPDSLFEEIDRYRLAGKDIDDDILAEFYPIDSPSPELGPNDWRREYIKKVYATDETYRRVAHDLAEREVDFLAVYFNGVDALCHNFWDYWKSEDHPLKCVIDNYYVRMDRVLGEFMDMVDERTLLVVCSDHGFFGPRRAADGGLMLGVAMHGKYGIVGLMGKGVRRGAPIRGADILDVTPTVLYALGQPVAEDMHGRVLTDGFTPEFLEGNPVTYIPTYETGDRPGGEPIKSPLDSAGQDTLTSLGYIQ